MKPGQHAFRWGSRGAGGKDYCAICELERSACIKANSVEVKYSDGTSISVVIPSEEQMEAEWQEAKKALDTHLPGWDKI